MSDQFAAWRHAIKGNQMDCGPNGQPSSGYFMRSTPTGREAVGLWKDPSQHDEFPDEPPDPTTTWYLCWRSLRMQNPVRMSGDEADEVLSSCSRYPIPYDVFKAVAIENLPWPIEYETRLTTREIQDGVCWTPELGKQKLEEEWKRLERQPKWAGPKWPL